MLDYDHPKELITPDDILNECEQLVSFNDAYSSHPLIQRFGSPEQPIYVDDGNVDINSFTYAQPLIMPIYDGQMELVQCAVMQDGQRVAVMPDGLARGFARYGDFDHANPVIITYSLEAFFKVAQTEYAVALVLLPTLCNSTLAVLKPFDFEQIQFVINQLSQAGYKQLYLPVRPEHLEAFEPLEENTAVRLLNQYQDDFACDLSQYESAEDVQAFLNDAIKLLPKGEVLPKGHLAKPMKWEDGHFHILEDGVFFIDEDRNDNQYMRFISSPILVIAKTRDDTSNNWGVLLEWLDDNKVKHTQALSMELFQTDGAELRKALAYQGVTISTNSKGRNLFSDYLANYPTAMRALCVDRVGWHGEVFVLPHERIGQSSNGDLIVYQANHGLDNRYQSKGTLEQWRSNVAQLVQNHSRLVFALCTAFAGQLLDPLNQQGGGFHIKGGSSKGKSTALNLACSVWGNPKHFYRTWRATGNALEHTAYMHNDSFLVLDEIGEIANPKELGNIVYMLSNGLGKGRMTKQITATPVHQWKIIFLSSGEKSLKEIMQEQGQKTKLGQEIRLADIDIDESEYGIFDCLDFAEDGAKQSIELASRLNQSYGVAGIAWLNYLTSNKAERIGEARELLEQYRQVLTMNQSQGHIVRVANYFSLVATAGEMAASAGITGWEAGTAFNAVQMVFNQWLGGFDQIGNFEDREILAQVKAFFEANGSSRFECITPDPIHPEKINNRAGYWKIEGGEKVYLVFSEQFKKEICKGLDYRKVAKVLKANQWINCNAKEYQKSERIPDFDKPMRMYVFNGAMWSWHDNENSHNSIRNIRNTRNSLDTQGFQPLRNTKIEYVTHVTKDVTANPMPDPVTYSEPVTYCENQTRNTANPSNDGLVTAVTAVTSKNNGVRDLLGEPVHPEPAKQEQPAPKKQAKAKLPQPEPVPANDDTLDLFGGML